MRRPRPANAFSLIELMIAVVFLVIAFFGYVALHARILHSGQRLEEKEVVRSATDFYAALLTSRAMLGMNTGPDGKAFAPVPELPQMVRLETSPPAHLEWLQESAPDGPTYAEGLRDTMELAPRVRSQPYLYSWGRR